MSHLSIKLNGHPLVLPPDVSFDVEDSNPYFNDSQETFSYSFAVPLEGNREVLCNADCVESDFNPNAVENMEMVAEVEGIAFRSGRAGAVEDQEVFGSINLSLNSAVRSLDEHFDGLRCRDVDVIDDIQIGTSIGNIIGSMGREHFSLYVKFREAPYGTMRTKEFPLAKRLEQLPLDGPFPALGFSVPEDESGRSLINTTRTYNDGAKFFNARVCYLHHKKSDDNDTSYSAVDNNPTDKGKYGKYNPYMVLEADRPASGICFYVLYFLDCLFARLASDGISYDKSQLSKVPELGRLAFFTTHCRYDLRSTGETLTHIDYINDWLKQHGIDTKLSVPSRNESSVHLDGFVYNGKYYKKGDRIQFPGYLPSNVAEAYFNTSNSSRVTLSLKAEVMRMYANSQNFPDADVKTIIDSLWGSFGLRFYLDQQTRVVRPMFIRDIFRDQSAPIDFPCKVISAVRETEKITGFRMKYSNESDKQAREDNITLGVLDYDTVYDYQDYRRLDTSITYPEIINQAYDTNMKFYVDLQTGNKYRVKIDGDAEKRPEYHPVIFEVGQLKGVEIGDCRKENQDFVHEVTSSFEPLMLNDVNFRNERKGQDGGVVKITSDSSADIDNDIDAHQLLAAFISEDMWPENIERKIQYPIGNKFYGGYIEATIKTDESFDPSSSKTGDSPLQDLDWGLAVTMMRGGGSDSSIDYYDYEYDGFNNCKFQTVASSTYSASYDSVDCYGQPYDYNGNEPGIGDSGTNGSYNGTYTKDEAALMIRKIWPSSNADLLSSSRKISGSVASSKGWSVSSSAYCTVLSCTKAREDFDGMVREFLVTPISDNGSCLSPSELDNYLTSLESRAHSSNKSIWSLDASDKRLLIQQFEYGVNASSNYHSPYSDFYSDILHQFHDIYYLDGSRVDAVVPPGLWIDHNAVYSSSDRFSLKIRSYINHPETGEPLCVNDPRIKNRGLFDTFMSEYAHFMLHRKKVRLTLLCEVSALLNIQWHKRYRFGDYVGWINKINTHITSEKGIESVTVELFVL